MQTQRKHERSRGMWHCLEAVPKFAQRASFDVAHLWFRPNGAAISQPRATPWVGEQKKIQSPERAKLLRSCLVSRPFRASKNI